MKAMTREQRRARRDLMNPTRHVRVPKQVRSARCRCGDPQFSWCHKHGRPVRPKEEQE